MFTSRIVIYFRLGIRIKRMFSKIQDLYNKTKLLKKKKKKEEDEQTISLRAHYNLPKRDTRTVSNMHKCNNENSARFPV